VAGNTYFLRIWTEIVKMVTSMLAGNAEPYIQTKGMDTDCEKLNVGRECKIITYKLRTWTEIVKMVSSKLAALQSHHLLSEDMDKDHQGDQHKVGRECRPITHSLKT
jgi:hypothetical protein